MKNLAALGLLLIGSAAAPLPLAAQKPVYPVHGIVKDTDGTPIQGVEVLLEDSERKAVSDAAGRFTLDGVPAGNQRLMVRRIGYFPVHPRLSVPRAPGDTLTILLLQVPQPLPLVEVQADRPGIRGTVGDTAYRALSGTRVELVGASLETRADSLGQFSFDNLKPRQYLLRLSRPGYRTRLLSANLEKKGLEYAIFLKEAPEGTIDWAGSNLAGPPLFDLGQRLAWEPSRNRMTRSELARYSSLALCKIPRLPHARVGTEIAVILRGQTVIQDADICAWSADQIELLEWGDDPCRETMKTVAEVLGAYCGPRRSRSLGFSRAPAPPPAYVVIWPRN